MRLGAISCIIPAFNCEQWLERAVSSLFSTQYPSLEIVIVDDGSRDDTLAVASRLQLQSPDAIRVLQHPLGRNRGVSASRNLGIEHSTGEWLCLLDADDYVYPHRFDSSIKILTERSDIDGVHQLTEMVFSTSEAEVQWFKDETIFGFSDPVEPCHLLERLMEGQCWATSAITFRRSLLERTGLFPAELQIAEDCHLWLRMAARGAIVSGDLTTPVSAYWRHGHSAYQVRPENRLHFVRSLTSFWSWCSTHPVGSVVQQRARQGIQRYVENAIVQLREQQRGDLALQIIRHCILNFPSVFLHSRVYRHLYHLVRAR